VGLDVGICGDAESTPFAHVDFACPIGEHVERKVKPSGATFAARHFQLDPAAGGGPPLGLCVAACT
jgi:hypothetical protein